MRFVLGILIPLTAALLQGTVAPLIAVGGARPSLPILVAASWSIAAGAREGVWWAFLGGFAPGEWRVSLDRAVAYRRADGNVSDKEKDLLTNLRL